MNSTPISIKEIIRQYRVISQMMTGHSMLRDKYSRRSRFLNIGILACSVVICAGVFASAETFEYFGLSIRIGRFAIGLGSIIIFFLSIVELRVDWKGRAVLHSTALSSLLELKVQYRKAKDANGQFPKEYLESLAKTYCFVMDRLVQIPEKYFLSYKAKHQRKIALSKLLSAHPGSPLILLRWSIFWKSVWRILAGK